MTDGYGQETNEAQADLLGGNLVGTKSGYIGRVADK